MWRWALEIIDSLDYGMAKFADLMVKHVFIPAISNISVTVSVEVLEKSGSTYPVSVLSIVPSEELHERQRRRLGRTSPRSSEIRQRARTHRGSLAGEEK